MAVGTSRSARSFQEIGPILKESNELPDIGKSSVDEGSGPGSVSANAGHSPGTCARERLSPPSSVMLPSSSSITFEALTKAEHEVNSSVSQVNAIGALYSNPA